MQGASGALVTALSTVSADRLVRLLTARLLQRAEAVADGLLPPLGQSKAD